MNLKDRVSLVLKARDNLKLQAVLKEKCKRDIIFWVNTFCWTHDPRRLTNQDLPFILYPFQEDAIQVMRDCILERTDFGIEKSRDMGATWMVVLVYQWFWQFHKGSNIHLGSQKEDDVDRGYVDPANTIFGKMRFNLMKQPAWLRPAGFDLKKHSRKLAIENPELNNWFTGESANPRFGRGDRYLSVGFDEFAFWEMAEAAWASASQSTNCRFVWSTPYGTGNKFAHLMNDTENELIYGFEKDAASLASASPQG